MLKKEKTTLVLEILDKFYPDACCNLNYANAYQLLVAVILSAQTSDTSVNKVTPELFKNYPSPFLLANAKQKDVETILHSLGLYHTKALNLRKMAQILCQKYHEIVPSSLNDLTSLPGVGRKTANVVRAVWFKIPSLAVDTHISRISKRLGFVKSGASILDIEKTLTSLFPRFKWIKIHHQLIYFGRYICNSKNPKCKDCHFNFFCNYYQNKKVS